MKKKMYFILLFLASCSVSINTAWASRSLNEIRYALFKDPNADVMDDLRQLVKFGDRQAMLLLGNQLMQDNGAVNGTEALMLFKKSFAEGQGEIPALTAMARLLDSNIRLRKQNKDYIKRALTQYPFTAAPRTLAATLEVFITYPDLISIQQAEKLIELYQRSCLAFCRLELYKAVLAERQANKKMALYWYEKAFFVDNRAVLRYYILLGKDQDKLFPSYAQKLQKQMNLLPVTSVHSIASILDTIYSTEKGISLLKARRIHEQNKGLTGAADEQAKAQEEILRKNLDEQFTKNENEINSWLDNAIARNWTPAMVSKVNRMTSLSTKYTAEETSALIDRVAKTDPQAAKALTVNISMVSNWSTLNPPKAYALIAELKKENYSSANMLLASLYSKGVLDEPDQTKALTILKGEAKQGAASAFYVMANIYYQGRAICRDKTKAYANLLMARDLGEFRATGLLKQVIEDMTSEEQKQGYNLYQQLAKEYQL